MPNERPLARDPILSMEVRTPVPGLGQQRGLVVFVVVIVAALIGVPLWLMRGSEKPYVLDEYQTAKTQVREFREMVSAGGTVVPSRQAEIAASVAGVVAEVSAKAGDTLQEGQVLAALFSQDLTKGRDEAARTVSTATDELDKARQDIVLETAKASVQKGRARDELAQSRRHLEIVRGLSALDVTTGGELSEAQDEVARLEADMKVMELTEAGRDSTIRLVARKAVRQLELAKANLKTAERALAQAVVRAPFTGVVLDVQALEGQMAQAGSKLLTLADVETLSIDAKVDVIAIQKVQVGQAAEVRTPEGVRKGRVVYIAPQASQGTSGGSASTVDIRIEFVESPGAMKPYSGVTAEIEVGRKSKVASLPRGLYLSSGDGSNVFVIDRRARTASRRAVTFGLMDGEMVEIVSGLEQGEEVLVSSYEGFREMQKISLKATGEERGK